MIKSFLMIGQSNMAGRGFLSDVPPIINERIQMLRNGRWQMMIEPVNYDRPVSGVSLAASFADAWCLKYPEDTIGLIPCAEGGSTLDDWAVDGELFQHAISEAKFAMKHSTLTGILWHQGESDSSGGKYEVYYDKLLGIVQALRDILNVPEIPFIIGGLGDYLGKTGFGQYCVEYEQINDSLKQFAFEQAHCYFVSAQGLTGNPDGIHVNSISQRYFGLRYFEAFDKKTHVLVPLSHEVELLDRLIARMHTPTELMFVKQMDFALGKLSYEEFINEQ
ncbi:carbohydrate acetyl esterase/feruloyl esterase precursor [Desulfosporosinus acididurans]|uniref:Carbohydrate acetyl esterase/feruloyl esterase n=1 Tax=Desulfosporosinus acididurans TaxID=476652 RepID=A0A0J1FSC7_9FIRM|nr:sialate O-acetylesterase [Desulfosporosinus acididurans]KLU66379.1 carbohydrate acetyl esterase/feruloyl esterase precursor [Desulfosporosinus acididurans]